MIIISINIQLLLLLLLLSCLTWAAVQGQCQTRVCPLCWPAPVSPKSGASPTSAQSSSRQVQRLRTALLNALHAHHARPAHMTLRYVIRSLQTLCLFLPAYHDHRCCSASRDPQLELVLSMAFMCMQTSFLTLPVLCCSSFLYDTWLCSTGSRGEWAAQKAADGGHVQQAFFRV